MSTTTQIPVSCFRCVAKLRALPKSGTQMMVIRNVEAMKSLVRAVTAASPEEELKHDAIAKKKLDEETQQYLAGIKHTIPMTNDGTWDMSDLGQRL